MYTLLECHVDIDLEGFEDSGEDGEPTGVLVEFAVVRRWLRRSVTLTGR